MLKRYIFTSGSLHLKLVNLVWLSLVDSSSDIHISRFTVTSRDKHIDGVNFVNIEFALIQFSFANTFVTMIKYKHRTLNMKKVRINMRQSRMFTSDELLNGNRCGCF